MLAVGFAFALDYTSSMMSIQPLWYVVGGPQKLYGCMFGSYDLASMLFAPAFGWWVDRSGRYKPQITLGGALNAAGNLVYAFTLLVGVRPLPACSPLQQQAPAPRADPPLPPCARASLWQAGSWTLMLVARLVAGVGTATLGIGSSYIAATTRTEDRAQALGG